MAYEQKPNEGTLFANKERESDSHPNAKGSALIGGVEYWVSAWTNVAQSSGDKYQKLKFTPKEAKEPKGKPKPVVDDFGDSDIPF